MRAGVDFLYLFDIEPMDRLYDIALSMMPSISCRVRRQLYALYEHAEDLFGLSQSELQQLFPSHRNIVRDLQDETFVRRAEREMEFAQRNGIRILHFTDPEYPQRLNLPDCDDTPTILYFKGNADLNNQRSLAVVGTRKATEYGKRMTATTINGFKQENILIVSGLAYGIDTAAHVAAVSNQLPTVGVVAHGLDMLYPPSNQRLAEQMMQHGGLITEYASGTNILPAYFPARNRIIAAMADGTLVAEASEKGGALITANMALSYHRDLMAFAGRSGDIYSKGCNRLIATQRALLVEDSNDILHAMRWERRQDSTGTQTQLFVDLEPDEQRVFDAIRESDGMTIEDLRTKTGMPLGQVSTLLLQLELKNLCQCLPGKRYKTY